MNEAMKMYCDGASTAYRDVAAIIRNMIDNAPPEIKPLMECIVPIAASCDLKAVEIYKEAERIEGGRH